MPKKNDTSWNNVAGWYDKLLGMDNTYQKEVILPNLLRLIDVKKGDRILDIACGQGFFSRALAEKGGEVTGVDLAPELIDFAKKHQGSTLIKYYVASADNLGKNILDKSFDKAVIVLAIQNIENLNGALAEASRALKVGGKLFLVLNHPAFRNPKHTAWDFDDKNKMQYRRVEEYLSESKTEIDMTPGTKEEVGKEKTVSFHRPLQIYFKTLVKNNFLVARLEEWNSNKVSEAGPRQKAEDKARKEIPLFLLIEAIKTR
jgi:ubiquinone/menaquinone biosynthesis C-methylase UbiE